MKVFNKAFGPQGALSLSHCLVLYQHLQCQIGSKQGVLEEGTFSRKQLILKARMVFHSHCLNKGLTAYDMSSYDAHRGETNYRECPLPIRGTWS